MKKIINNLYLGDMYSAPKNADIVISCAEEIFLKEELKKFSNGDQSGFFYSDEKHVYFDFKDYPIENEISKSDLKEVFNIMKSFLSAQKKVYIHCVYGVNRSASITFMYLVKNKLIEGENYLECQKKFWKIYPNHSPNPGWKKFLSNNFPYNL